VMHQRLMEFMAACRCMFMATDPTRVLFLLSIDSTMGPLLILALVTSQLVNLIGPCQAMPTPMVFASSRSMLQEFLRVLRHLLLPRLCSLHLCQQICLRQCQRIPDIADSEGYELVYELGIPTNPNYRSSGPLYSTDTHLAVSSFNRVAYYLDLGLTHVWVSMDAFTDDSQNIGVPCLSLQCGDGVTPTVIQQIVNNVNVVSNVAGLSGSGYTGNVEFWPYNYSPGNSLSIPGASSSTFDYGDTVDLNNGSFGSMQVHVNGGGGHRGTVFAFNRFNDGAVADLGISNNPNGQPDWSLSSTANIWNNRKLRVYVAP